MRKMPAPLPADSREAAAFVLGAPIACRAGDTNAEKYGNI